MTKQQEPIVLCSAEKNRIISESQLVDSFTDRLECVHYGMYFHHPTAQYIGIVQPQNDTNSYHINSEEQYWNGPHQHSLCNFEYYFNLQ